jgi:hypothetical protein
MTNTAIETIADEAMDAFWQVIARHFPEAESGDLSPLTTIRFETAAKDAITEWILSNVPSAKQKEVGNGHSHR